MAAALVASWWNQLMSFMGFKWHLKTGTVVVVGIDNAGKSTMLYMMRTGKVMALEPTMHPGNEEIVMGGMKLNAFDLGGHAAARRLWTQYIDADMSGSLGIVFMVDARDVARFDEAHVELARLVVSCADGVPVLVLGNKIDGDKFGNSLAVSAAQLGHALNVDEHDAKHPCKLFMCSVVTRTGLTEAFDWLATQMK